jgi:hypothetical protein
MNTALKTFDTLYQNKTKHALICWDFGGRPRLFFGTCCSLSPICDNLLPTVAICDDCEVLSISDNLSAVLLALFLLMIIILFSLFFFCSYNICPRANWFWVLSNIFFNCLCFALYAFM